MVEKNLIRRAVIDLGTNTFNLLIADVRGHHLEVLYHEKLPVMLGMGGINHGFIAEDALMRAEEALAKFKTCCDAYQVKSIRAIGTSALRDAANSQALLDFAMHRLGIRIRIVSGMDEANFIYHGVRLSHDFQEAAMIMDIGGGSTEFILADRNGPSWSESYDIGVSRIYQRLGEPEEFGEGHFEQIVDFLEMKCGERLPRKEGMELIGSSGTFETLYEMIFERPFPEIGEALELPLMRLREILEWSKTASLSERLENPWIVPIRKRMLPISAVKVLWVLEKWSVSKVWVSPYSLKEGALLAEITD